MGQKAMAQPNVALTLQQVQERPSNASRMQENLLSIGALPRIPLCELTALPRLPSWLSPAQERHPRSRPFEPRASTLAPDTK